MLCSFSFVELHVWCSLQFMFDSRRHSVSGMHLLLTRTGAFCPPNPAPFRHELRRAFRTVYGSLRGDLTNELYLVSSEMWTVVEPGNNVKLSACGSAFAV